jgi:hypothetical protein
MTDSITRKPEGSLAVKAAAVGATLVVIVDGAERTVNAADLVKATVQQMRGQAEIGGMMFLRNFAAVQAAAVSAENRGGHLKVISFKK